jgi:hypothetical protein
MRRVFRKALRRALLPVLEEFAAAHQPSDAVAQKALMQQYRLLTAVGKDLPRLSDVGFRAYSQFEEDGILLYIFSLIPPISRTCVEICAGDGRECNTANLIINHGWWGHLFDGDEHNVRVGTNFYARHKDTFIHPPRFTQAWITAEDVNGQIAQSGAVGPIDLLSLDIDGMDYWIWKAITVIEPQVVVCETHNPVPPDRAVTVPYDPKFVTSSVDYMGASLAAMCKLGRQKGYRLIGTHRFGFNAFFMKQGIGEAFFPEVDVASCVQDPFSESRRKAWPGVQHLPWQEV